MDEQIIAAIARDWDIKPEQHIGKEQILQALAERISQLLTGSAETFFQLMYRLDIAEQMLSEALSSIDPPQSIAMLIWDRQQQKFMSRARYSGPASDDPDLKW